jgi:hypothetical protein
MWLQCVSVGCTIIYSSYSQIMSPRLYCKSALLSNFRLWHHAWLQSQTLAFGSQLITFIYNHDVLCKESIPKSGRTNYLEPGRTLLYLPKNPHSKFNNTNKKSELYIKLVRQALKSVLAWPINRKRSFFKCSSFNIKQNTWFTGKLTW